MSTLTPDLWAAYAAARRVVEEHSRLAALNLVPHSVPMRTGAGHTHIGPHPDQALERAREAQAAAYEAQALYREVTGGSGGGHPPQPPPDDPWWPRATEQEAAS